MLNSTDLKKEREKYDYWTMQNQWSLWISEFPFTYALTLTFKQDVVNYRFVEKTVDVYNRKLKQDTYGQYAIKGEDFKIGNSPSIFASIEKHKDGNLHVHCLVSNPVGDVREGFNIETKLLRLWEKLTGSCDNKLELCEAEVGVRKYSRYMLKEDKKEAKNSLMLFWDNDKYIRTA